MLLHDLLDATDVLEVFHDAPIDVSDVTHDSRTACPGALFCCIAGTAVDGHDFAAAAVNAGVVALMVERELVATVPQARVQSVRVAIGPVAARLHGDPSHRLPVVGVTGTNGKTTVTYFLEAIFAAGAMRPALVGTTGVRMNGVTEAARFTTPEAPELQRTLADLVLQGADVIAMEVSSHSLAEHRIDGTRFAAACFTNLTQDHLDYHGTLDEYAASKARLFTPEFTDRAAINVDDPYGRKLARIAIDVGLEVLTYTIDPETFAAGVQMTAEAAAVRATDMRTDIGGTTFRLAIHHDAIDVRLPVPGRFNVVNALAAAATATLLGIELATIAQGLSNVSTVPGRFEIVGPDAPVSVIVDYAHTPDGIAAVLRAARELGDGCVIAVFGCGGDRDTAKRSPMGEAAGRGADFVVLTSDNPRSEDPATIAAAAAIGLTAVGAEFEIELDRRLAIRAALARAVPGDTVMILGKGAETVQHVGATSVAFDDRVVAAEEMDARWN